MGRPAGEEDKTAADRGRDDGLPARNLKGLIMARVVTKTKAKKKKIDEMPAGTLLVSARLPGLPPSVNALWRHAGNRTYKPRKVHEWQEAAAMCLHVSKPEREIVHQGEACYLLLLKTQTARLMDCDNREKVLQDCLESAYVVEDDSQFRDHRTLRIITGRPDETVLHVWAGGTLPDQEVAAIIEHERGVEA